MMANHSKIISDIACFTAHFTSIVGAMNLLPLHQRMITFYLGMGKASTDLAKGNHCNGRSIPLGNDMIITDFWTIFLVFIKPPQRGCCDLFDAFHGQCSTSVGILAIVTKIKAGGGGGQGSLPNAWVLRNCCQKISMDFFTAYTSGANQPAK